MSATRDTVGKESVDAAFRSAFSCQPGGPQAPSLLASYLRWREREAVAKAAEEPNPPTPMELEERAHARGLVMAGERLQKGDSRDVSFSHGYISYRGCGGRLSLVGWLRKVAR